MPLVEIKGGQRRERDIVRYIEDFFPKHTVSYVTFDLQPFVDFQLQGTAFYHLADRWIAIQPNALLGPNGPLAVMHEFAHNEDADDAINQGFDPDQLQFASYVHPDRWDGWVDEKEGAASIWAGCMLYPSRWARRNPGILERFLQIWQDLRHTPIPPTADWQHQVGFLPPYHTAISLFPVEFQRTLMPFSRIVRDAGWESAWLWRDGTWKGPWRYDLLHDRVKMNILGLTGIRAEPGDWIYRTHAVGVGIGMNT